eukprot:TRINITY_DN8791_c0_g1_i1.p1 TRINITY_DN8791_c0_g1~~TRINITY_DN8791_c0_g1_i1.p1  ORF type:complete len:457 (+),score=1.59 TRINITY_DN8791_c0_g1_i1:3-1373(+)
MEEEKKVKKRKIEKESKQKDVKQEIEKKTKKREEEKRKNVARAYDFQRSYLNLKQTHRIIARLLNFKEKSLQHQMYNTENRKQYGVFKPQMWQPLGKKRNLVEMRQKKNEGIYKFTVLSLNRSQTQQTPYNDYISNKNPNKKLTPLKKMQYGVNQTNKIKPKYNIVRIQKSDVQQSKVINLAVISLDCAQQTYYTFPFRACQSYNLFYYLIYQLQIHLQKQTIVTNELPLPKSNYQLQQKCDQQDISNAQINEKLPTKAINALQLQHQSTQFLRYFVQNAYTYIQTNNTFKKGGESPREVVCKNIIIAKKQYLQVINLNFYETLHSHSVRPLFHKQLKQQREVQIYQLYIVNQYGGSFYKLQRTSKKPRKKVVLCQKRKSYNKPTIMKKYVQYVLRQLRMQKLTQVLVNIHHQQPQYSRLLNKPTLPQDNQNSNERETHQFLHLKYQRRTNDTQLP